MTDKHDGTSIADANSSRRTVLKGIGIASATVLGLGASNGSAAAGSTSHVSRSSYTIRDGTDEETTVYTIDADASGPTVLVVGGVHGNEESGWLAALDIKEWEIDAGKLVVLPKANATAIDAGHRPWGTWDLNRHFPSGERPKSRLAQAIWNDVVLEYDPDFVWDLHSSQGIYSEDEGVGQALFPTRAGDARSQASDVRSYLNDNYVPDAMPTYEFTGTSSVDGTREMLKHKLGADLDTPCIIFETVYDDLSLARQVAWTKAAVRRQLRNYGLISRERRILTIVGHGDTAHYEFTVDGVVTKSAAYDAGINSFDTISGDGTVTGRTTSEPDSFAFTGEITDFEADAPVDVYVDGQAVDPETLGADVITVVGDGATAHYEFTVDGAVEKSTAHGGTINGYDTIHDDGTVTGRTTSEPDSFAFTGTITDFEADAPVVVSINGEMVDPAEFGDTITISGDGSTSYYEFTVDGSVSKSTEYGGTINSLDTISGDGTVTGRTTSEPDSFTFTGEITGFEAEGNPTVQLNGREIEPVFLGADVITIVGDGATAHYEFTVDGSVEKSTAHGGTINGYDTINGDGTVTGRTTSEPDSFAFTGEITGFEADAPVVVYADGESVALN